MGVHSPSYALHKFNQGRSEGYQHETFRISFKTGWHTSVGTKRGEQQAQIRYYPRLSNKKGKTIFLPHMTEIEACH